MIIMIQFGIVCLMTKMVMSIGEESSTRIVLSSRVLESYLSNLKIDTSARLHALKHINEQFEDIYNLRPDVMTSATESASSEQKQNSARRKKLFRMTGNKQQQQHRGRVKSRLNCNNNCLLRF